MPTLSTAISLAIWTQACFLGIRGKLTAAWLSVGRTLGYEIQDVACSDVHWRNIDGIVSESSIMRCIDLNWTDAGSEGDHEVRRRGTQAL